MWGWRGDAPKLGSPVSGMCDVFVCSDSGVGLWEEDRRLLEELGEGARSRGTSLKRSASQRGRFGDRSGDGNRSQSENRGIAGKEESDIKLDVRKDSTEKGKEDRERREGSEEEREER